MVIFQSIFNPQITTLFNHMGSFEDFSILTYEVNPFKLLIKESLQVSRDKPLLNK